MPDDLPALVPDDDYEQSGSEPKPTTLTGDLIQLSDRPQAEAVEFAVLNKIANVEPNNWDKDQRKQEKWIINRLWQACQTGTLKVKGFPRRSSDIYWRTNWEI